MKKIVLMVLFFILFLVLAVQAEKVGELTDLARPQGMIVKQNRLYVIEGARLFSYRLPSLHLVKTFGKEGEGPGELQTHALLPNRIVPCSSGLMVEGLVKIMLVSPDLELIREIRKRGVAYQLYRLKPFGQGFVGVRMVIENPKIFLTLTLFDGEMKVVKDLYRQETVDRDKEVIMVRDTIHYQVHSDRLYVEESEGGFRIGVYSGKGERIKRIKHERPGRKLTGADRDAILEDLRADNMISRIIKSQGGWVNFKKQATFTFPETFPAIKDLLVDGDKLYVLTFHHRESREEWVVLDLNGRVLGVAYLPKPRQSSFTLRSLGRENRFFAIADSTFYYLMEDDENEVWALHREKIKLEECN